jgi:hypothetical protein
MRILIAQRLPDSVDLAWMPGLLGLARGSRSAREVVETARRSADSRHGKECTGRPFGDVAKSTAIAEWILPVLVFNILSPNVQ